MAIGSNSVELVGEVPVVLVTPASSASAPVGSERFVDGADLSKTKGEVGEAIRTERSQRGEAGKDMTPARAALAAAALRENVSKTLLWASASRPPPGANAAERHRAPHAVTTGPDEAPAHTLLYDAL